MVRARFDEDIRPLTEFRSGAASFLKQIHETKRPLVLTQRGRGVAVLVDVRQYEAMQERLELLEDLYQADRQLQAGEGIDHKDAKARVLARLKK
jgi:antitoxin YefM